MISEGSVFYNASETCALDIVGASFVREVENGEIVIIENNEIKSLKPFPKQKSRPCIFEYIYFSRPDSLINNISVCEYRKKLGAELAKESHIDSDLIVPVPDSGVPAAIGYSEEIKKNIELGIIRNHYVGGTFIEPTQQIRSLGVKLKLNANKSSIKNKKIILVIANFFEVKYKALQKVVIASNMATSIRIIPCCCCAFNAKRCRSCSAFTWRKLTISISCNNASDEFKSPSVSKCCALSSNCA